MDRLRSPGGCPWDAEQTHESLLEYLLEECYETIEAVETGDDAGLREELGDLLLQVVFHARIAAESDPPWDIDDIAVGITDKLVRRHPHVFGDDKPPGREVTPGEVAANWTVQKAREKGRSSALEGVPLAMPALALAQKTWRRAHESGLSLGTRPAPVPALESPADLGRQLLALTVLAEDRGWDAEAALRAAVRILHDEVRDAEAHPDRSPDPGGDPT
jgi:XTP/dITP diphosphohydrolase